MINTCTVTENGDMDSKRLVRKACQKNKEVKIALIGCQAQIQKEKLAQWNNVRWIIGNAKKMDLLKIIEESDQEREEAEVITPTIQKNSFFQKGIALDIHHTRANMKIQDGCDFFCSFCEIPYARGRARSRDFQNIIDEAKILADNQYKEVVLTGINLGTYQYENKNILDVINAFEDIEGIKRIRISSIEPTTIAKEMVKKMGKKESKLCPYLHIPIQSANNKVLKDMNRKYTLEEFNEFVQYVYQEVKDVCIGTDVLTGYPTETEKEFEEGIEYLRESPINYFHVFRYSPRYMAKSRFIKNIPSDIMKKRSNQLRELSNRKKIIYYQKFINREIKVLFEEKKNEKWTGLTDNYIRVVIESEENLKNEIKKVSIKNIDKQKMVLRGELEKT